MILSYLTNVAKLGIRLVLVVHGVNGQNILIKYCDEVLQ